MDNQAEICETYQLKWSSYNAYIHSCISTSFRNDSFADVALVTVDGHQIMAHRFVLSYSSQFLGQILRYQPKVTTALPIMIVMPPEIDYKSLKVLVRYMYSGEAKVSKDILNAVLKGGDLLQIKGLYREKDDLNKNPKVNVTQNPQKIATTTTVANTTTNVTTTTTQTTTTKQNQIILNKSVPVSQSSPVQMQVPEKAATPQQPTPQQPGHKILVVQKPKEQKTYVNPHTKVLNFTIMKNFDKKQKPAEPIILNKTLDQNSGKATDSKGESSKKKDDQVTVKTEPGHGKESNLQYLMIKNEPIEWSEADMELIDSKEIFDDMTIKSENTEQEEESNEESNEEENLFSPLTCELCTERFTIPGEWVRHVQTHTDMLPAKRRRRDSPGDSYENDTFPELMCDMCQKSFTTPAEWVQHIQKTHTEFELHLCNKTVHRTTPAALPTESSGSSSETTKMCTECDKTFPSHASMVIHRRRHTGEKPYNCEYCNKSFNVKSNLLRHLRTLHNKIVSSTEVGSKDNSDNSN